MMIKRPFCVALVIFWAVLTVFCDFASADEVRDIFGRVHSSTDIVEDLVMEDWTDQALIDSLSSVHLSAEDIKDLYERFTDTALSPPDPGIYKDYSVADGKDVLAALQRLGKGMHNLFLSMSKDDINRYGKLVAAMRDVLFLDTRYLSRSLRGETDVIEVWHKEHNDGVKSVDREYITLVIGMWGGGPAQVSGAVKSSYEDEGYGTAKLPDGSVYKGGFSGGLFNGQGVRIWKDGHRYEGEYRDGLPNGYGVETWPDGTRYEGEFLEGEWNGSGVVVWKGEDRFEGEFRKGEPVR